MALPTAKEKTEFVNDLIGDVRASVLAAVPNMPEDWDGHELRQYIADKFAESARTMSGNRLREYANARATISGL